MFLELVSVAVLLLSTFLFLWWTRNFNFWKARGIPGPEPSLIYGSAKSVFLKSKIYSVDVEEIYKTYRHQGHPVVGYFAGRKPYLLALDTYTVKEILIRNFAHFADNEVGDMMSEASDPIISQNPFFLRGEAWKEVRKEVVPGFTINRIRTFYPIMKSVCERFTSYVAEQCKDTPEMDIDDLTGRFTGDLVSDVIFGINANALADKEESLVITNGVQFLKQFQKIGDFFRWNAIWPSLKRFYKYRMLEEGTFRFFLGLIQQSVECRERGGNREDFLQFLLQLKEKKGISINRMLAHAMTFFLDGYDTTSVGFSKVLMELARNPRVQEKLRAEVMAALEEGGGEITFDELMRLEYLDAVINESLRLHPPIAMLIKKCTKTFQLHHPDHAQPIEIPEGVPVLIHIAAIHRDEAYFEDALQFNPERFITGDAKKMNEEGMLLIFGGGARVCLGMKFAIAQMKAGLFELVRNFTVSQDPERAKNLPEAAAHFLNYPSKRNLLNVKRI